MLDAGGGVFTWVLATVLFWGVPILLTVWFIRTLSAMLEAQRAMVEQLKRIA